jgi:hypothetical protein
MIISNCPTCGAVLNGRSVCGRCGSLAAAEALIGRTRFRVRSFLDRQIFNARLQFRLHHFLWLCAVVPLVFLPPLFALGYSFISIRRDVETDKGAAYEWIAILSAINLIISVLVLYQFKFSPNDLAAYVADSFDHLRYQFFPFRPPQPSPPRLTPI